MQLEQHDKELAAIGAAIGCNCRPCIEYHIKAGREAGLAETDLRDAIAMARRIRDEGIELLGIRIDELVGSGSTSGEPVSVLVGESRADALVALGASIGVNSHALLERQTAAALSIGLTLGEARAATKMAEHVQRRASEMTAEKGKHVLEELSGVANAATAAVWAKT